MRSQILVALAVIGFANPVWAQSSTYDGRVNSGIGNGVQSEVGGTIGSGLDGQLGDTTPRTLADPLNPDRVATASGDCAPGQSDPDHRGCRPTDWARKEGADPNRIVTYSGDGAFRSGPAAADPNAKF
jgi:hypothetical protein